MRPHLGRVWTLGAVILASAALAVAAPLTIKLVFDRALFPERAAKWRRGQVLS